ncbi:MAG: hypothetical protein LBT55_05340 [Clostridiaceae bacterium]|jgi:hypothetical protein|nr:hypothetical protein [Clostridiaceae bacterium]
MIKRAKGGCPNACEKFPKLLLNSTQITLDLNRKKQYCLSCRAAKRPTAKEINEMEYSKREQELLSHRGAVVDNDGKALPKLLGIKNGERFWHVRDFAFKARLSLGLDITIITEPADPTDEDYKQIRIVMINISSPEYNGWRSKK